MHVRVISLGSNWWEMHSHSLDDPLCFRRNAAWFNSAALRCGRRIRFFAAFPGQIRLNASCGFNPEFPSRALGRTFLCSGPNQYGGRTHLLFAQLLREAAPDAWLVTLSSGVHGAIEFTKPGWRSVGVQAISISLRGARYEAMLLLGASDWVQSDLGRWMISGDGRRLMLSKGMDGGRQ
jgi:hypothetical protein